MKAELSKAICAPAGSILIYRAYFPVECWKCGRNSIYVGYPYGKLSEPNCERCIREMVAEAVVDAQP